MRLDLYLKLVRLVKRRTLAQEMVTAGAVRLGGRRVKPAAEVKEGVILGAFWWWRSFWRMKLPCDGGKRDTACWKIVR